MILWTGQAGLAGQTLGGYMNNIFCDWNGLVTLIQSSPVQNIHIRDCLDSGLSQRKYIYWSGYIIKMLCGLHINSYSPKQTTQGVRHAI
jgi:hypothetical protein